MKKIIRLTESDLVRIVKRVLNEENNRTIVKPKEYTKFQENCKTKDNGSFRTFVDGIHLRCMKEEGSTFHPVTPGGLIVKENPFGRAGVNGTWKLVGNNIELRSAL
jgi:hypothetical protein